MREVLSELNTSDPEHPSAWLTHETGWTLDVYEGGLCIWDNMERDDSARHLWMKLYGYGSCYHEVKLAI